MAKFIQICASQNDLFALDDEGRVRQYDFNTKTWELLAPARFDEGSAPGGRRPGGGGRRPLP